MTSDSKTPANLSPQAFSGTSEFYLRYRPPYPAALIAHVLDAVRAKDAALDLACGPGRVALALAPAFRQVCAIDLEPEMIATGVAEAARRRIANVEWSAGRAEDQDLPPASFDLVTIGEAFHRLDQRRTASLCLNWLKPGGCLVTIGGADVLYGSAPWQRLLADFARDATRHRFPGGWAPSRPGAATDRPAVSQLLQETGFVDVSERTFVQPYTWSIEGIGGYLQSTSVCSRNILGDRMEQFLADLKTMLLAHDPSGAYREEMTFGCTIARKAV